MASNIDFVQYIVDQCSKAGDIVAKKMFGDYGIYCDGKIFGLICDDKFFLKPTEAVRPLLRKEELRPPYEGAKDYFYIADVDDRDYLSQIVGETYKALPEPKPKKKNKASKKPQTLWSADLKYSTLISFLLCQYLCIFADVHSLKGCYGLNGQRNHC